MTIPVAVLMPFIIGTAGHIDHGKTSLIRALTGMDTDRLKEEKERGISIDLGFAYLDLPDGAKAGIVDVPGHERFIKNMLAGATGIDLVLFVVAADDGIMPQTKEHLEIMHLLGIGRGIFVITKTDLVEKGRVDQVTLDVKALIKGASLEGSPVIPVSSATGSGIDVLKTLIAKEARNIPARPEAGFFRLTIDRSFSIKGFGTVVTGTVASGSVKKNDDVIIISKKQCIPKKVKIRGMQSHFNEVTAITAGQRAAVNLSGISHAEIERGDVLASPDMDSASTIVAASFEFLSSIKKPIKNNSMFKLHHMTDETIARVSFEGIKEAAPGAKTFGFLRLKEPMTMMRGDRFILRDPSINSTIGGGKALLPYIEDLKSNKKTGTQHLDILKRYQALGGSDMENILLLLLSGEGISCINIHTLRLILNIPEKAFANIVAALTDKGKTMRIGECLILKEKLEEIEQVIVNIINNYHRNTPGDVGVAEEYITKAIKTSKLKAGILKTALDGLIKNGKVARNANLFHLPSHKPEAKGKEKNIEDAVVSLFQNRGFNPLKLDEILQISYKLVPEGISRGKEDIKNVLQLLVKRGMIIKVTEDSYTSKAVLDETKAKLADWVADKGKIKAAEFRDILGCGRKFAIELLEYFDKEKITLRSGDYRILRKAVKT
jgi:selenocysteine-specific elongation factor